MQPKPEMPFELHFLPANRGALRLLRRLLAFDPAERPTAEEALADPYFTGEVDTGPVAWAAGDDGWGLPCCGAVSALPE